MDAEKINKSTKLNISNVNFPVAFMFEPEQYRKTTKLNLPNYQDPREVLKYNINQLRTAAEGIILGNSQKPLDIRTALLALGVNGKIIYNPLYQSYNSMSSFRLGESDDPGKTAVKYIIEPCEKEMRRPNAAEFSADWTRKPHFNIPKPIQWLVKDPSIPGHIRTELEKRPNYLTEITRETLNAGDFCFDFKLQPFVDHKNTPVEDPSVLWVSSEDERSYWSGLAKNIPESSLRPAAIEVRKVSEPITVAKLNLTKTLVSNDVCEDLQFTVWENVPDVHKPLGVSNRMRWFAYRASFDTRSSLNQSSAPRK